MDYMLPNIADSVTTADNNSLLVLFSVIDLALHIVTTLSRTNGGYFTVVMKGVTFLAKKGNTF